MPGSTRAASGRRIGARSSGAAQIAQSAGGSFAREHPDIDVPTEAYTPMGITAENVAARWAISREQQDAFAVESQRKASRPQAEGRLDDELVPVITPDGTVVDRDLCLRPQTSLEGSLR